MLHAFTAQRSEHAALFASSSPWQICSHRLNHLPASSAGHTFSPPFSLLLSRPLLQQIAVALISPKLLVSPHAPTPSQLLLLELLLLLLLLLKLLLLLLKLLLLQRKQLRLVRVSIPSAPHHPLESPHRHRSRAGVPHERLPSLRHPQASNSSNSSGRDSLFSAEALDDAQEKRLRPWRTQWALIRMFWRCQRSFAAPSCCVIPILHPEPCTVHPTPYTLNPRGSFAAPSCCGWW